MKPTTTTGSGATHEFAVDFSASPPLRTDEKMTEGLFRVEVRDAMHIRLIPLTALAQSIAEMWLHWGPARLSYEMTSGWDSGVSGKRYGGGLGAGCTALTLTVEGKPHITEKATLENGDPFGHERILKPEEAAHLLAELERLRKPKATPKRKRRK